jgi:hypothetical protein
VVVVAIFKVAEPEPLKELELRVAVTPAGAPKTVEVRSTAPLNPFTEERLTVAVALLPAVRLIFDGEAARVKFGLEALTGAKALMKFWPVGLPHPVTKS